MANNGKYALVTGATNGIGYELAKQFAQNQYNLVIVARHQEELDRRADEFRQQYGVEVVPLAKDLFNREAPFEVYEEVKNRNIQLDVLVNNAGQGQYGEFLKTDIERELAIIQLNIAGYVVLTKCFLKDMVKRGEGKILNVSSIAGEMPGPYQAVYHATKAFVTSFSEAVRSEVTDKNITITALLPGLTDTDFFHKAQMENSKILEQQTPADPAEVAKDGYEALMKGDDKIVSGFKNKIQVGMSNVLPDSKVADTMKKQMEPKDRQRE